MAVLRKIMLSITCFALLLGPVPALARTGEASREAGPRAPMPDLIVVPDSYYVLPADPHVGDFMQLYCTVKNIGDANATTTFDVRYFLNNTDNSSFIGGGEVEVEYLEAGTCATVSETWKGPDIASGINYTIIIFVDPFNWVSESNESNNQAVVHQSVGPRLYTDLYIPPGGISVSPSSPFVGDNVIINASIMNNGEKNAIFVNVFFYINDTDHPISSYEELDAVNLSGPARTVSMQWNSSGFSPGPYRILVIVNPSWSIYHNDELHTADNNRSLNVTLRERNADLYLRNVTSLPLKPLIGQGMVVTGDVVNAGSLTSEPCNLSLFVDFNSTPVASVPVPSVAPGESRFFVITWNSSGLSAAVHRMRIVVDPDYRIADANQTNNTFTWSMEFEGVVNLMLANLTISPPLPGPGDTVHFSVTVVNAGSLRCNSANLTLRMGGAEADRKQLLTLSAGGQLTSSLKWSPSGMVPGLYDYEVSVSPGPGENDSFEGNNMLSGQLLVQPPTPLPDLRIASVALVPPGPVHNGDTIVVAVTVENAGTLDANGSFLDIKLVTANGGIINFTDSPVLVPSIPAGGMATVNISRDTANYKAGNYSLKALADFRGDLAESNESNNIMLLPLRILEALPRLPKLGVEEFILEGKLEQDQKMNIFVVINNTGDADALNVVVGFIIDGKPLGSAAPIPVIGRQSNRTAAWLWVPAAGKHTIGITVSADGVTDQYVSRSVTVPPAPSTVNPYIWAAGITIIAVVLGVLLYIAIGARRRPMPRMRLVEEEEEEDEDEPKVDGGPGKEKVDGGPGKQKIDGVKPNEKER